KAIAQQAVIETLIIVLDQSSRMTHMLHARAKFGRENVDCVWAPADEKKRPRGYTDKARGCEIEQSTQLVFLRWKLKEIPVGDKRLDRLVESVAEFRPTLPRRLGVTHGRNRHAA